MNEKLYAQALREFESDNRNEGLYAKCFAEADGDEDKAKARYIKNRVNELSQLDPPSTTSGQEFKKTLPEAAPQKENSGGVLKAIAVIVGIGIVIFILDAMGKKQARDRIQNRIDSLQTEIDANQRQQDSFNEASDTLFNND